MMVLLWQGQRSQERRKMPAMPRSNGKAKKIAWKILGIPPVFKSKQSKQMSELENKATRDSVMRHKGYTS